MYKQITGSCAIIALWFAAVNIFMPWMSKQNAWAIELGVPVALLVMLVITYEWCKYCVKQSFDFDKEKQQ